MTTDGRPVSAGGGRFVVVAILIVIALTAVQFRYLERRVHY